MTNNYEAGTPRKTIDANGNVIDKPYGASRWAAPRKYECKHDGCDNTAIILFANNAHNCCNQHEHYETGGGL